MVPLLLLLLIRCVLGTERPIIGILTEEVSPGVYPKYKSTIAASYVKAVEQSGARVAPIFINGTEDYYRDILSSVNGVLLPGGGLYFNYSGGFADAGRFIVNITKTTNRDGDHFPILGICLGYELLFYLEVESYAILTQCNSTDVAFPLKFRKGFRNSRLYQGVSKSIIDILSLQPVTYNYHMKCITEELIEKFNLTNEWHLLSTSTDLNGIEFISSIESRHFPIAGIQFHPEKNAFEWNPSLNIPHTHKAISSSRHFFDWLVKEARRNNHSFVNSEVESSALIYKYNATYTGYGKSLYEQRYLFK